MRDTYQKNIIDFKDLCFRRYPLRELKLGKNHPVHAIDTETYKGYARLITADDGCYLLSNNIDDYLAFLTKKIFMTSHNFCYNLRYDAQAILKYLPKKVLRKLWAKTKAEYKGYKIRYIPKKVLSITLHKNRYAFYDIAQFFNMSLEKAAKQYLHKKKNPGAVDAALLNTSNQYWRKNQDKIIEYCKIDSLLTKELGEFLQDMVQKAFHINPQNYVSVASISKQYVRKKCTIPKIQKIPKQVLRASFDSYKGGRFEVLKKGHIGNCTLLDIKSAYSYEISNLIDVTKGDWIFTRNLHEKAYYGFYKVLLCVKMGDILPIPFRRRNGVYCYPMGVWTTWMTKQEILAYEPYIEYEIKEGYEFYPVTETYPFKEMMLRCFKEKESYDKKDFRYDLSKKIPNSLYGLFYQKYKTGEKWYTGQLFNPVYASIITANTRIKLFMKAMSLSNEIIAFATDSILIKGKIYCSRDCKLGDWEKEIYGDAIILKTGIYRIADKIKTRGMKRKTLVDTPYGKYKSIFDYIEQNPKLLIYPVNAVRPVSMGEALMRIKTLSPKDINQWRDFPYKMDINRDYKRIFKDTFRNGGEIFTKSIASEPLIVASPAQQ